MLQMKFLPIRCGYLGSWRTASVMFQVAMRCTQVGAVVRGTVASVKPYGIFVRMEGFRANALVHLSQVQTLRYVLALSLCRNVLIGRVDNRSARHFT